jgi:hypothetical protein
MKKRKHDRAEGEPVHEDATGSRDDETVRDEAIMSADDTGMVRNEAQIVSVEETEGLEAP